MALKRGKVINVVNTAAQSPYDIGVEVLNGMTPEQHAALQIKSSPYGGYLSEGTISENDCMIAWSRDGKKIEGHFSIYRYQYAVIDDSKCKKLSLTVTLDKLDGKEINALQTHRINPGRRVIIKANQPVKWTVDKDSLIQVGQNNENYGFTVPADGLITITATSLCDPNDKQYFQFQAKNICKNINLKIKKQSNKQELSSLECHYIKYGETIKIKSNQVVKWHMNHFLLKDNDPYIKSEEPTSKTDDSITFNIPYDGMISIIAESTCDPNMKQELTFIANADGSSLLRRKLTAGEIEMAKKVYGDSINYDNIYIYKGGLFGYPDSSDKAVTPNGDIYFPSNSYRDDYSNYSYNYNGWFMHEMAHVWQWQNGTQVWAHGVKLWASDGTYESKYQYDLSGKDSGKKFNEFNIEQQASIIARYYNLKHKNETNSNEFNELKNVLSDFLLDPSNKKLQPKPIF